MQNEHKFRNMDTDDKLDMLNQRIDDLFKAIQGDPFGNPGYRNRIEDNEQRLSDHEKRMADVDKRFNSIYNKVIGISIGVTIAATAVGWIIRINVAQPVQALPTKTIAPIPVYTQPVLPDSLRLIQEANK